MKKVLIGLSIVALGTTLVNAKPNIDNSKMHAMLAEKAGKKGVFAPNENFPKDYFLITKNLPYMAGLTLHHPQSSTLGLSKEQIGKIVKIKKTTVPSVVKMAKKIKALELEVAKNMENKNVDLKAQYPLLEKIAKQKIKLSKAHIDCIKKVRNILTDKQFETLKNYVSKMKKR